MHINHFSLSFREGFNKKKRELSQNCLTSCTTQGLSTGALRIHVAHVTCPQACLEVSELWSPKSPISFFSGFETLQISIVGAKSTGNMLKVSLNNSKNWVLASGQDSCVPFCNRHSQCTCELLHWIFMSLNLTNKLKFLKHITHWVHTWPKTSAEWHFLGQL